MVDQPTTPGAAEKLVKFDTSDTGERFLQQILLI